MPKVWEEDGCLVIDNRLEWQPCPNAALIREWCARFPEQEKTIKDMICQGWAPMACCNGKVLGFGRITSYGKEEIRLDQDEAPKCEPLKSWDDDDPPPPAKKTSRGWGIKPVVFCVCISACLGGAASMARGRLQNALAMMSILIFIMAFGLLLIGLKQAQQ